MQKIYKWSVIFTPKMVLETVDGDLLKYKELEPDSLEHSDQITTERQTDHSLRGRAFHTADGNLYTIRRNKNLWAVTRLPQNLILSDIDEAYRQLTGQGNYFPSLRKARRALNHEDTVIVEHEGLELKQDYPEEYGYFVINPRDVGALNSQRRIAAQRVFGPDEKSFYKNIDMFAEARIMPRVYALMPDYVRKVLKESDKKFLMRASWLNDFYYDSNFLALDRSVLDHLVHRVIAEGDAPENEVSRVPQEMERLRSPTIEEILAVSRTPVPEFGFHHIINCFKSFF